MTDREPALSVDRLCKAFGDRLAFEDVSFEVGRGEVFGFLGPNGAGKTTTVRTLGTLIAPTAGSATVAGIPLTPENGVEIRRRIAIMPESPGLYLRLSVLENLECFADLYEVPDPSARIDARPRGASTSPTGRTIRAARCPRACASGSPSRGRCSATPRSCSSTSRRPGSTRSPRASVHELIDGLRQRGVTIFLTTHRLEEAERLCDRVAILNTTLRTIGRPDELRDQLFAQDPDRQDARAARRAGARVRRACRASIAGARTAPRPTSSPCRTRTSRPRRRPGRSWRPARTCSRSRESQHSLEDVYLELIDEDVEAAPR